MAFILSFAVRAVYAAVLFLVRGRCGERVPSQIVTPLAIIAGSYFVCILRYHCHRSGVNKEDPIDD